MLLNERNFVLADCIDTSISSKKKKFDSPNRSVFSAWCRPRTVSKMPSSHFPQSCQMLHRSLNPSVVQTESALVPIPKRRHGKQNSACFDVLAVSHVFLSYHSVLKVRVAFSPGCSRIKSSGLCGPKRLISNFSSNDNVLNCTLNK